jgi:hypothetical protein
MKPVGAAPASAADKPRREVSVKLGIPRFAVDEALG